MLNSRAAIVVYAVSPSRPPAIAGPKYRPDCAAAAPNVVAAASADGIITVTVASATTPTAPATSALTVSDRFRCVSPRWAEGMIATMASFPGRARARLGATAWTTDRWIPQRRDSRRRSGVAFPQLTADP